MNKMNSVIVNKMNSGNTSTSSSQIRPYITLIATLLQEARVIFSHVGSSNKSVKTSSSSSKLDNSPSPLIALTLRRSGDRFLVNLRINKSQMYHTTASHRFLLELKIS